MHILFTIKVKIIVLVNGHTQLRWFVNVEWLSYSEHTIQPHSNK